MESISKLICRDDRLKTNHGQDDLINLKKLNDATLLRIIDSSKLITLDNSALHKITDCSKLNTTTLLHISAIDTDEKAIKALKNLFSHPTLPPSLEEIKSIPFDQFSENLQHSCLGMMLIMNAQTDMISVLLDLMKSVNYGQCYGTTDCKNLFTINPLIHCCHIGRFDLVKLLIDKYAADIEHQSYNGMTAIMYSTYSGHREIMQYLYEMGARLETPTQNIINFATGSIKVLIEKWKADKEINNDHNKLKSDFEMMKSDFEKMKSENDLMKRNILNLIIQSGK